MSAYTLGRLATFPSTASTQVVLAAQRLSAKPMLAMKDHPVMPAMHHNESMALPNAPIQVSPNSMKGLLLGSLKVTNPFTKAVSYRQAHTDIKVPSFDAYRNKYTRDPSVSSKELADDKNTVSYISTFGIGMGAAYTAKSLVHEIVVNISPAADVLAMAQVEVKLSDIPEGKNLTIKWRSKPLFIRHRTQEEIDTMNAVNMTELRDQQTDDQRTKDPKYLVIIGICTHLGCVPIANAGDFNGYFCPCHGSHYDASGRIRKGPAPLNLEVPPYTIEDDLLIVG